MPLYEYQCTVCNHIWEEFFKVNQNSGRSFCPRCGNVGFKIPSVFTPRVFKPRKFADGTETPPHVTTFDKEKKWMREKGITYDKPHGREKYDRRKERREKSKRALKKSFEEAIEDTEGGRI